MRYNLNIRLESNRLSREINSYARKLAQTLNDIKTIIKLKDKIIKIRGCLGHQFEVGGVIFIIDHFMFGRQL